MEFVQPLRDKKLIEKIKTELRNIDEKYYIMFILGINTGLRISDLLKLKVKDVKNSHIVIREEKTGKLKRFPINAYLRKELDLYILGKEDEEYLFPSRKRPYHIQRVQAYRILNTVARKFGLQEIGTHTLRKTFGYWYYKKTKDVALLQEIFNHSSPAITLRYIGINNDVIDESLKDFTL